jgi:hypothetical protein
MFGTGRTISVIIGGILLLALSEQSAIAARAACLLESNGGPIKCVIHLQFDDLHLRRHDPQIPSERMITAMHNVASRLQDTSLKGRQTQTD